MTHIDALKPYAKNAKKHPRKQVEQIANSIREFGFNVPIVVDADNVVIAGHGRLQAAYFLGMTEVPTINVTLTEEQAKAYRLADNKLNESPWEMALVVEELKLLSDPMLDLTGFTKDDIRAFEFNNVEKGSLVDDLIIPPFSVWDTKQKYWQDRKERWNNYFGDSKEGRDDDLLGDGLNTLNTLKGSKLTGTSEFDPVAAEVSYRWFCPANGSILDPFAGGVVRGAVAGALDYTYTGIDLSERQIEANKGKLELLKETKATYIHGNSVTVDIPGEYDMIFSCPPYYDLEQYSSDPDDLSNKGTYTEFLSGYRSAIRRAVEKLKTNRFAVFVVGDVRDAQGVYRGFVPDTINAFTDAGMHFYNDVVLLNALGTAPLRSGNAFKNRKLVKVHQNVLVFYKGNVDVIQDEFPVIHSTSLDL